MMILIFLGRYFESKHKVLVLPLCPISGYGPANIDYCTNYAGSRALAESFEGVAKPY